LVPWQSRTPRGGLRAAERERVSAGSAEAVCRTGTAGVKAAGHGARDSGLLAESYTVVPTDDQGAVEAHILEVARWERAEIARQIALVRQEAERRYQAAVWHGYHLGKDGRSWERAPAQENLFDTPQPSPTVSPDNPACVPEDVFASSSPIAVPENQIPVFGEERRTPAAASSGTGMESFAGATVSMPQR